MPRLIRQEFFYGLLSTNEINRLAESATRKLSRYEDELDSDNFEGLMEKAIDIVCSEFIEQWRGALHNWEDNYWKFLSELGDLIRPLAISRWQAYIEGRLDL